MKLLASSMAIGFILGVIATAALAQPYSRDGDGYYSYRRYTYRPLPRPRIYRNPDFYRDWTRSPDWYRSHRRDWERRSYSRDED